MTCSLQARIEGAVLAHHRRDVAFEHALRAYATCDDTSEPLVRARVEAASDAWRKSVEHTSALIMLYRLFEDPRGYQETLDALHPKMSESTRRLGYQAVRMRLPTQTIGEVLPS